MAAIPFTSWASWSSWQRSILLKVGALFLVLFLAVCTYLITASNLSGQLTGASKAIEQAGTERMRIYKLASLVERFTPSRDCVSAPRSMVRLWPTTPFSRFSWKHFTRAGRLNSSPLLKKRWQATAPQPPHRISCNRSMTSWMDGTSSCSVWNRRLPRVCTHCGADKSGF